MAQPKRRGHPVLFPGEREKMSVKVTTKARQLIQATQAMLKKRGYGHAATEAAAVEYLVRKASRTGLRLPPVKKPVSVAPEVEIILDAQVGQVSTGTAVPVGDCPVEA